MEAATWRWGDPPSGSWGGSFIYFKGSEAVFHPIDFRAVRESSSLATQIACSSYSCQMLKFLHFCCPVPSGALIRSMSVTAKRVCSPFIIPDRQWPVELSSRMQTFCNSVNVLCSLTALATCGSWTSQTWVLRLKNGICPFLFYLN